MKLNFEDFIEFGSELFVELVLDVQILIEGFQELDGFGMIKVLNVCDVFLHLVFPAFERFFEGMN